MIAYDDFLSEAGSATTDDHEPQIAGRRTCIGGAHWRCPFDLQLLGFDYLLVESAGILEPLVVAEPRLGRRTVLTFPLSRPPQKN